MNLRQKLITDYFFSPNLYWISVPENLKKNNSEKEEQEQTQVKNDTNINIIRGYNPETDSWHCSECGVDMGSINPRQLCGKYYCKSDC